MASALDAEGPSPVRQCPCCGGRMIIVETFEGARPASSPSKKLVVFVPARHNARHQPPKPNQRSVRDPKIPIGRARPNSAHSCPRFPPYEAFGRRPRVKPRAPAKGRRPKPFSKTAVAKDRDRRCNGVEPGLWEASTPSDWALPSPQTALIRALFAAAQIPEATTQAGPLD